MQTPLKPGTMDKPNNDVILSEVDAHLRAAMDALPVAVIVAEGLHQRVLFMNRRFTELFGYTANDVPDVAHWWPLAFPDPDYRREMQTTMEDYGRHGLAGTGEAPPVEAHVVTKSGQKLYIEFRVSFLGGRSIVAFSDLTARKRAEDSLEEKQKHSASLLSLARSLEQAEDYPAVVQAVRNEVTNTIGLKTVWVYLLSDDKSSARLLMTHGTHSSTVEDMQALSVRGDPMMEEIADAREIVIVEDARTDQRTNKEIVQALGNRTIVNVPIQMYERKLGSFGTGTFGEEGVRILTPSEKDYLRAMAGHLAATLHRIHETQQKTKTAQSLRRFNRALQTLSNGNEALVRARDEESLLQEMCNVLVKFGGYQAALIVVNAEPARRIAWTSAPQIVPELKDAALASLNGGHLARAFETAKPGVIHSRQNLEEFLKEEMGRAGIESLLSLPISDGSTVLGILTIFSSDPAEFDSDELKLLEELAGDLSYGVHTLRLRVEKRRHHERLTNAMESAIESLASALELRDSYTAGHQRRVAELAVVIARHMGLPEERIKGLYLAGFVHDIGKIYVPAEILTRPGRLSAVEFALVKTHVDAGYEILKGIDFPWPIAEIVRQHHENMDGSGYPRGLKGEELLLEARILSAADMVEAITNHRPYRPALGMDFALKQLLSERGTKFDPLVVDACIHVIEKDSFVFTHRAPNRLELG